MSTTFYIFLTKYFIVTKYKGQGEGSNHYKPFNLPKSHAKSTFFHFYNKKRAKISSFRPLIHTHKPFFSLFYHVSTHFFPFYFVFHQVYTLPLFPFQHISFHHTLLPGDSCFTAFSISIVSLSSISRLTDRLCLSTIFLPLSIPHLATKKQQVLKTCCHPTFMLLFIILQHLSVNITTVYCDSKHIHRLFQCTFHISHQCLYGISNSLCSSFCFSFFSSFCSAIGIQFF